MSSSLWSLDRTTHIKIVAVSLVAASVVVAVGMSARTTDPTEEARGRMIRAGEPASFTANDTSIVQ